MPRKALPHREPINEHVNGLLSLVDEACVLSASALSGAATIAEGSLCLRYGIPYFQQSDVTIVPELLVLDRGEELSGEAAWQFLMRRSHLFPRADLLGFRSDGVEEMVTLKQLDFDSPYSVLAYAAPGDDAPLAAVAALIADDASGFPERLLLNLPRFDSLEDWRAHG